MKELYLKITDSGGRWYYIPFGSFEQELTYYKVGDKFEVELIELDPEAAEELNAR